MKRPSRSYSPVSPNSLGVMDTWSTNSFLSATSRSRSKPSEATFLVRSGIDSSNEMNTPGSPYWVAPRTRNSSPNSVFPAPAPPLTRVGRPCGNPPPVISSKPWIPVAAFGSVLEDGWLAFFFCPIYFILASGDLWRVGSGVAIFPPRRSPLIKRGPLSPFTIHCFSSTLRRLRLWVGFEGFRDMSQSTETLGNVLNTVLLRSWGLGSICCDQSAVTMRLVARLASIKLTFLPRTSTTSRTTDSEYPCWAEFFFHGVDIA